MVDDPSDVDDVPSRMPVSGASVGSDVTTQSLLPGEGNAKQRTRNVSFIIPTLNEYESIEELHTRILSVCKERSGSISLFFS